MPFTVSWTYEKLLVGFSPNFYKGLSNSELEKMIKERITPFPTIQLLGGEMRNNDYLVKYTIYNHISRTNLEGANMQNIDLTYADLMMTNLSNADLTNANLSGADFTRVNLTNADLRGSNITETTFTGAFANSATKWPEGFNPIFSGIIFWD